MTSWQPVLALTIDVDSASVLATTGRILLVVVLALVLRAVLFRAIARLVKQATETTVPVVLRPLREKTPSVVLEASPLLSERRRQRAGTIGSALRSVTSIVVFALTVTTILGELGVDLGPVLASAGIVGVAVGFGAQNVIKDWLNGMFMILEDQYGVGDVIDAGQATGTVEAVALRTTRLRSEDGTVWHVRNGEVLRVGNLSQGYTGPVDAHGQPQPAPPVTAALRPEPTPDPDPAPDPVPPKRRPRRRTAD